MAIAAVPDYLLGVGTNFSQASPGLRFGMLLPLWGVDQRSGEQLWGTSDINYRSTGPQNQERRFEDKNKTPALRSALELNKSDQALLAALRQRQAALAAPLAAQGRLLVLDAVAVAPFTTGLGNAHPLENGFAFLNPYGLPYLPGSGVKGVLRQAARELADHQWGDAQGWTTAAIDALFGVADPAADADEPSVFQRGALLFWDVLPQIAGNRLQVEVMTPHQSHYYQNDTKSPNGANPHESGQPNPINFLTVPPGSAFVFHVQCNLPLLARFAPDLADNNQWQRLMQAALRHAFAWLGFGAKTAVGYGAMAEDAKARQLREQQAVLQREAAATQARTERIAAMGPAEREAEAAASRLAEFRLLLADEQKRKQYKPGSAFDGVRADFLNYALTLSMAASRQAAALALRESYKFTDWPGKKERKAQVKAVLTGLDGQA